DLVLAEKGHAVASGRDRCGIALSQLTRRAAGNSEQPYILLHALWEAARIGGGATPLKIAATRVDKRSAVRCPCQLAKVLAIVLGIGSELPRLVVRRLSYPDVTCPSRVEHPCYRTTFRGSREF